MSEPKLTARPWEPQDLLNDLQDEYFSGWISVKDRLPEAFQPVIICREKGKGEYIVEQGYKDVNDWWKVYGTRTKSVTHWMPLPEPPEEGTT